MVLPKHLVASFLHDLYYLLYLINPLLKLRTHNYAGSPKTVETKVDIESRKLFLLRVLTVNVDNLGI
jgi:hypothetical protein